MPPVMVFRDFGETLSEFLPSCAVARRIQHSVSSVRNSWFANPLKQEYRAQTGARIDNHPILTPQSGLPRDDRGGASSERGTAGYASVA
jgi:hypothetical protein